MATEKEKDAAVRKANAFTLPSNKAEATKVAWNYHVKLSQDRKHIASRMRDVIQDAKADGYAPQLTRAGCRLRGMKDDKREDFIRDMAAAVALYGFKLEITEDDARDEKLLGYLRRADFLRTEKRELSELFKALSEACEAQGVDYPAIKHAYTLSKIDERRKEKEAENADLPVMDILAARIDVIGAFIGLW